MLSGAGQEEAASHLIVGRARNVHDDVGAPAGLRELRELAVRAAQRRRLIDLELRHLLHAPATSASARAQPPSSCKQDSSRRA